MKKGKYIDYNILLACLSHKSKTKMTQDYKPVIEYPLILTAL